MERRSHWLSGFVILLSASIAAAQAPQPPGGTPGGPMGGFRPFEFPQPGQILTNFLKEQLKLNAEQKKQLADLQKDVDARLTKILTADQKKAMQAPPGTGGFGGFGPPGGGPGAPKGGPAGPPGGGPGGGLPKGGFGGGFGGFGGGFGMNPNNDAQKRIGATDEEWKVIGPKLQKVLAAKRIVNGDAAMGGPFGAPSGPNVVAQAQAELKTILDDPKHSKSDAEEKIAGVRKARERARADVVEAQRDLSRMLTPAQQAVMVSMGHLE